TDAIKGMLLPLTTQQAKTGFVYANEADVVNLALFGMTAKEWRVTHKELVKKGNIRDFATVEQLTVLANLESLNSMLINDGVDKKTRYEKLHSEAQRQLSSLLASKMRLN